MKKRGWMVVMALALVQTMACATQPTPDDQIRATPDGDYFEPQIWDDDPAEHFAMVEEEFLEWDALVIEGDGDEYDAILDEKLDGLDELIAEYEQVTDHGDEEWTSAAFYRIADMLQRTAQELFVAPIPVEEGTDEYWAYHDELDELAVPLEREALERYEDLLWWAAANDVENEWVAGAFEQVQMFAPVVVDEWIEEFPQVTEFIVTHYQELCEEGYAWECGELAQIYREGQWVEQDLERTRTLFERACEFESAECVNLGVIYAEGEGVEQDQKRAVQLFEASCYGGDMVGCLELAFRVEEGTGVEPDEERAVELFAAACAEGLVDACDRMEALDDDLEDVEGDVAESEEDVVQGEVEASDEEAEASE